MPPSTRCQARSSERSPAGPTAHSLWLVATTVVPEPSSRAHDSTRSRLPRSSAERTSSGSLSPPAQREGHHDARSRSLASSRWRSCSSVLSARDCPGSACGSRPCVAWRTWRRRSGGSARPRGPGRAARRRSAARVGRSPCRSGSAAAPRPARRPDHAPTAERLGDPVGPRLCRQGRLRATRAADPVEHRPVGRCGERVRRDPVDVGRLERRRGTAAASAAAAARRTPRGRAGRVAAARRGIGPRRPTASGASVGVRPLHRGLRPRLRRCRRSRARPGHLGLDLLDLHPDPPGDGADVLGSQSSSPGSGARSARPPASPAPGPPRSTCRTGRSWSARRTRTSARRRR